jgi:hypothetical protein
MACNDCNGTGWLPASGFCSCSVGRANEIRDCGESIYLRRREIASREREIRDLVEEITELEIEIAQCAVRREVLT